MKTILVPIDFTETAGNAAAYAAELAKVLHYKILLYHSYYVPIPTSGQEPPFALVDPKALQSANKKRIQQEARLLSKNSGVQVGYLTTEGFPEDEIIEIEKKEKPDMIIMGMKKAGTLSEHILGSIATDIISNAHTPVITVPEKVRYKKIESIAFAAEHRKGTAILTQGILKDIEQALSPKMYVLNVVKEKKLAAAGSELSGERRRQYFEQTEHTHHFLEDNDLIHGLNEFIGTHQIDMIAMFPHKHTLLERLFKEPRTKKMAYHTNIPLLTLPENYLNDI